MSSLLSLLMYVDIIMLYNAEGVDTYLPSLKDNMMNTHPYLSTTKNIHFPAFLPWWIGPPRRVGLISVDIINSVAL